MEQTVDSDAFFQSAPTADTPVDSDAFFGGGTPETADEASRALEFERSPNYPNSKMTDPSINDAMTVYGAGSLAKAGVELGTAGVKGLTSFFETPESLKSAGISTNALQHMVPEGQNPADWANAVEDQFSKNGWLAKTGKDTFDLMSSAADKIGQAIGVNKEAIQSVSPDILMVDANKVLEPIANEALKRGTGLFSKTENLAKPFYDAYDGLMNIAKQQGGKLTMDNLDSALKETGELMDEGGDSMQQTFSKLYGKIANAREIIVDNVANQVNDPALKEDFLKNNADYSTLMRLIPGVAKSAMKEAVKEGMSGYAKYLGPMAQKIAVGYGGARLISDAVEKGLGGLKSLSQ